MTTGPCPPIEVRPFSVGDGEQVGALIVGIQSGEFGMPIGLGDQPDLADIERFYKRGAGSFWVADQKGTIVGTVGLIDIGGGDGALRKMFVDAAFRGRGFALADRLLDALLTRAREKGIRRIYLGTAECLHAAHKFYRRRGFEEIAAESLPASFPIMGVDTLFFTLTVELDG